MQHLVELVDRIDYGKLASRAIGLPALAGECSSTACRYRRVWPQPLLPSDTTRRSGRRRSI